MTLTILLFFTFFIEAIILWQYASSLFLPSHSVRIRWILLSTLYTMLFLLSLFRQTKLNIICFFIANTIFLYTQFKLKLLFALFHSAILTTIMGLSELAILGITLKFSPYFLTDKGVGLIFYAVFSKLFFFAIIYLLAHLFKGKNTNQRPYYHSELFLMLIPILSVFIMYTFLFIGENAAIAPPVNFMVTACAIFLLLINLLVFGLNQYLQKKYNDFIDMQLLLQKESDSVEYYEMLLSQNENQRILIHDIKKHLLSIKLLNEQNCSEKIDIYIQQLMKSSDLRETVRICDNEMLNAILCRYQRQCNDKHIAFHADIRSNTLQHIYQHDITSLFCNLMDNAVEAADNIPESFIELTVQKKENSHFIVIIVINSCQSAPLYNQNGFPISRKANKERHGFGIKSINKIVQQYQGNLEMYYDITSGTFHTLITLKTLK